MKRRLRTKQRYSTLNRTLQAIRERSCALSGRSILAKYAMFPAFLLCGPYSLHVRPDKQRQYISSIFKRFWAIRFLGKASPSSSIASEGLEKQNIHQVRRRAELCSTHHGAYHEKNETLCIVAA
ncbi:hypothetical protein IG631_16697 [Alternaria alternata]|nr:hypothetical protein IG631_16697 [Alternaria alternata]